MSKNYALDSSDKTKQIEEAVEGLSVNILNALAQGKTLDDADDQGTWLESAVTTILPVIVGLINGQVLPNLPIAARDELTLDDVLPDRDQVITSSDVSSGLQALIEAEEESPLSENEAAIKEALETAETLVSYTTPLVNEDHIADWLAERSNSLSLPDWVQEAIDWEAVVGEAESSIKNGYGDTVDIDDVTFYPLDESDYEGSR